MTLLERLKASRFNRWWDKYDRSPVAGVITAFSAYFGGLGLFAWITARNAGIDGLRGYLLTALVAAVVGFLAWVFLPYGSGWLDLAGWIVWPLATLGVIYFHGFVVAWIFGSGVGMLAAAVIIRKRHRRNRRRAGLSGPVLLRPSGRGLSRRVEAVKLNLTVFREALPQLDGDNTAAIGLAKQGKRLDICGDAAGRLVVHFTDNPHDDDAWRRLATPGLTDPDTEVTVPMGNIEGHYRQESTVDINLALQAGEHFIRTGEADPEMTWESGDDVHSRLPPIRLGD